jgi:energy-coupling factor transport system permease protein
MSRGLGQFYPVASPLHALDPRAKILATAVLVLGLFLVDSIAGFLVVATAVAALVAASGIPAGAFLRILRPVAFIVACDWACSWGSGYCCSSRRRGC